MRVCSVALNGVHAGVLAPVYSIADRRFRKWEDVRATTRIILSRVEMRVTSLPSSWQPCNMNSRWTHCAGFSDFGGKALEFFGR